MHPLGWGLGTIESWWDIDGLHVAHKCARCGKLSGDHIAPGTARQTVFAWDEFPSKDPYVGPLRQWEFGSMGATIPRYTTI